MTSSFRYCSKANPCVICGRQSSDCRATDDLHFCLHNHSDGIGDYVYVGPTTDGTWGMFSNQNSFDRPRRIETTSTGRFIESRKDRQEEEADRRARELAKWTRHVEGDIWGQRKLDRKAAAIFAVHLGLPASVFECLPVRRLQNDGYNLSPFFWAEKDGDEKTTNYVFRYCKDGRKIAHGGSRGLTIPNSWRQREGPLLIPEGMSDTLALTAMDIAAVGRPNAKGGVDHLAKLLADFPADRDIIVLGENDRKDDGLWPGREGALSVAEKLADRLGREVLWALPPDGAKDVRHWFREYKPMDLRAMRRSFLSGLDSRPIVGMAAPPELFQGPETACLPVATEAAADEPPAGNGDGASLQPTAPQLDLSPILALLASLRAAGKLESPEEAAAAIAWARREEWLCPAAQEIGISLPGNIPYEVHRRCGHRGEGVCDGCRLWHLFRDLANIEMRLREAVANGERLYAHQASAECWPLHYGQIRYREGQFFRFRGDPQLVITTAALPEWPEVAVERAVEMARATLEADTADGRAVASSRAWELERLPKTSTGGRFEGMLDPIKTEEVFNLARETESVPRISVNPHGGKDRVIRTRLWDRPGWAWTEEAAQHFWFMRVSGTVCPFSVYREFGEHFARQAASGAANPLHTADSGDCPFHNRN